MQKCEKCNTHFSWSEIYKSYWRGYKPIKCNECDTTHKITVPSRFIFVFFTILPMLIFGIFISPFFNVLITLGIAIFIYIIGSLLAPFFVTYKKALWTNVIKLAGTLAKQRFINYTKINLITFPNQSLDTSKSHECH